MIVITYQEPDPFMPEHLRKGYQLFKGTQQIKDAEYMVNEMLAKGFQNIRISEVQYEL